MIQTFSVQNHLSYGEKQTLSLLATADKHLLDEVTIAVKPGVRLLRMAMIYGANASGKSNMLHAIQSFWELLFFPRQEEHMRIGQYQPFALHIGEPTEMECQFWAYGRKYQYRIVYHAQAILHEKLQYTTDTDTLALAYERFPGQPIKFGTTLGIRAKERNALETNTLKNHSVLATMGKINIDVPMLTQLYAWVKGNVRQMNPYHDVGDIAMEAAQNPALKQFVLRLLNKADLDIADFELIDVDISEGMIDRHVLADPLYDNLRQHLRGSKQLIFKHRTATKTFSVTFGMESKGTQAYFRLARMLFDLRHKGCICLEDELEDSLHDDLLLHYLQMYLELPSASQLLFTTHNQLLLDEDWMVRRDMVWFTEKDKEGGTQLYPASSMGIHKNVSLRNAYRIGKLGAKPVLGSPLLSHEELGVE